MVGLGKIVKTREKLEKTRKTLFRYALRKSFVKKVKLEKN